MENKENFKSILRIRSENDVQFEFLCIFFFFEGKISFSNR